MLYIPKGERGGNQAGQLLIRGLLIPKHGPQGIWIDKFTPIKTEVKLVQERTQRQ